MDSKSMQSLCVCVCSYATIDPGPHPPKHSCHPSKPVSLAAKSQPTGFAQSARPGSTPWSRGRKEVQVGSLEASPAFFLTYGGWFWPILKCSRYARVFGCCARVFGCWAAFSGCYVFPKFEQNCKFRTLNPASPQPRSPAAPQP